MVLGLGWYQKVMGGYIGCGVRSCMFSVRGGFLVVGMWGVEYSSGMDGLVAKYWIFANIGFQL